MDKTDFKGLANLCVQKYKDSLDNERERYVDTLFVAITEKDDVLCSKIPSILEQASKCVLIHQKKQLAVTNWYSWYKVDYVDGNGCVTDGNLSQGFELSISSRDTFANQVMSLYHGYHELYACRRPWEDNMAKVWKLYSMTKKMETDKEIELTARLFRSDEKILEMERKIASHELANQLLKQERDQYKSLLDEIKKMVSDQHIRE